jgi:hypothetical protein
LCEECLDTVETEHNGHVIYNIENAAKEIRKQTETKIVSLKEQIDKARKQKHELDKHRFSSSEKRNSRREVSNLASNLASAIVTAIEDQQRLDKDIIAEGVTKLQNTIDVNRLSSGNSALVLMVGNSGFSCAVLYFLNKWIFSKSLYAVDIL